MKRLGLALITLFILSVLVFAAASLLPGNIGRNVLGPFASERDVEIFNRKAGADRPLLEQYWDWVSGFVHGDFGNSLQYSVGTAEVSVTSLLGPAFSNSVKLAAVAFVILVPLSILGGVIAGLRRNSFSDRFITVTGVSFTAIPEFVTAIVFILLFGLWLDWLPVSATAPPGANPLIQIEYLLLPAFALVAVEFGYIARITRSSVVESVDADYTRTAYLKGLTKRQVVGTHVLRNSLLPTIAVVATQVGYLIGGLLVIEKIFNYNGIGLRIYTAAQNKDYPVLQTGVMLVGVVYLLATLFADILYSLLNPRVRFGGGE